MPRIDETTDDHLGGSMTWTDEIADDPFLKHNKDERGN
jgi:hypothetical protein